MNKFICLIAAALLLQACSHPLEIVGQGDIVDLNDSRHGCTLAQYESQAKACTKNMVVGAYDVDYNAQPAEGYEFVRWDGPCGNGSISPNCAHKVPAAVVKEWVFKTVPATIAVFCPSDSIAYRQDFEAMTPGGGFPPNDLEGDGWVIFGAEYTVNPYTNPGAAPVGSYGPFPAADAIEGAGSIQAIGSNEGGRGQGQQHLNKFTDYNNFNQPTSFIEGLTLQETTVTQADVGIWTLSFDAKRKSPEEFGIGGQSSAYAFIKTLDPHTFNQKGFSSIDMTSFSKVEKWGRYSVTLVITQAMVGDILQFGFSATAINYEPSGIYYDNIFFGTCDALQTNVVPR